MERKDWFVVALAMGWAGVACEQRRVDVVGDAGLTAAVVSPDKPMETVTIEGDADAAVAAAPLPAPRWAPDSGRYSLVRASGLDANLDAGVAPPIEQRALPAEPVPQLRPSAADRTPWTGAR
jgi:hypothetical protein